MNALGKAGGYALGARCETGLAAGRRERSDVDLWLRYLAASDASRVLVVAILTTYLAWGYR